ncbi:MAG TPA: hypothetical protein VHF27_09750 [Acidimicrobiales bacterium]|nr:hypothetical protein [Acidimicrobiales bacterium]
MLLLVLLTACGDGTTVGQTGAPGSAPPETTTSTSTTTTSTSTTTTSTTSTTIAARRSVPTTQAPTASGGCHPSYSGACLPIGPDVDCGEISARRFRVVGPDVYRLDADSDGIACES